MDILHAIRSRIAEPQRVTDMPHHGVIVGPPLSIEVIHAFERGAGIVLPNLLRDLYSEVGDGGFGPGYGFRPLAEMIESIKELAVIKKPLPPSTKPPILATVVDWGCDITSLIDCADGNARVIRSDEVGEECYSIAPLVPGLFPEADSLADWLQRWLDGENLFDALK